MLIIFATIMTLTTPTGSLSPSGSIIYLTVFRIVLGVGVGGDYPMSATISSDRAAIRKRGVMLNYIFANQGWGSFVGALAVMIVLACYKHAMRDGEHTSLVDGVWRITVGISLIPAFATLYQRLTLPESRRFEAARKLEEEDPIAYEKMLQAKKERAAEAAERGVTVPDVEAEMKGMAVQDAVEETSVDDSEGSRRKPGVNERLGERERPEQVIEQEQGMGTKESARRKKAHFRGEFYSYTKLDRRLIPLKEFLTYFSEWRHAKILIGTAGCWFLLDIA